MQKELSSRPFPFWSLSAVPAHPRPRLADSTARTQPPNHVLDVSKALPTIYFHNSLISTRFRPNLNLLLVLDIPLIRPDITR